jgi:hypothetical protein
MIFPRSALDHAAHHRLGQQEGRGEMGRDHAVPALGRKILDRRALLDAGVVDENLDRPVRPLGRLDQGAMASRSSRSQAAEEARPPASAMLRSASASLVRSRPTSTTCAPGARQPLGHREPEAGAAAGDERNAAGEV